MTRIRSIKPALFRHEELFEAEQQSQHPLRLVFIGLFTCCDREGRFRWQPRQLKLDILPYDDIDFAAALDALATYGFVKKYQVDDRQYGCIPTWHKHQCINNREMASDLPLPVSFNTFHANLQPKSEDLHTELMNSRVDHASSTRDDPSLNPLCNAQGEYGIGNREKEGNMEGKGKNASTTRSVEKNPELVIFEHWKKIFQQPQAKLDDKRKQLIQQAMRLGYSVANLCEAITGCSLTPYNTGQNDTGQRYDGLNIILRDADQIDRFIKNAQHPPQPITPAIRHARQNIRTAHSWLNHKLGMTHASN